MLQQYKLTKHRGLTFWPVAFVHTFEYVTIQLTTSRVCTPNTFIAVQDLTHSDWRISKPTLWKGGKSSGTDQCPSQATNEVRIWRTSRFVREWTVLEGEAAGRACSCLQMVC